jgi:hypothetical protein
MNYNDHNKTNCSCSKIFAREVTCEMITKHNPPTDSGTKSTVHLKFHFQWTEWDPLHEKIFGQEVKFISGPNISYIMT